jgi:hypothetical protein
MAAGGDYLLTRGRSNVRNVALKQHFPTTSVADVGAEAGQPRRQSAGGNQVVRATSLAGLAIDTPFRGAG